MVLAETRAGSVEAGNWQEKLGIWVPIAPVVLSNHLSSSNPVAESRIKFPESHVWMWATSPIRLPPPYSSDFWGVAVIDPMGFHSNLGVALSLREAPDLSDDGRSVPERQPFFFSWNKNQIFPEIAPISRVQIDGGTRRLVHEGERDGTGIVQMQARRLEMAGLGEGERLIVVEHPSFNNLVHREGIVVAQLQVSRLEQFFGETVREPRLVSGKACRHWNGRESKHWPWPFEMLFGLFEPRLVGKRRLFNRDSQRFNGWAAGTPKYVG